MSDKQGKQHTVERHLTVKNAMMKTKHNKRTDYEGQGGAASDEEELTLS
jgi:hypothetical protein